jgi:hypothetical protein
VAGRPIDEELVRGVIRKLSKGVAQALDRPPATPRA